MASTSSVNEKEHLSHFSGRQSEDEHLCKRLLLIFLPQLLILVIFFVYIGLGAFVFVRLDEKIANKNFTEVVLFCFTTLATIGYGNIGPSTTEARCFCLLYTTLGVPLCVVVLGNLSKHLKKAFWMIRICFGGNIRRPMGDTALPLKAVLFLYIVVYMFGCLIYPEDEDPKKFTLRNLYFSVVSFSTVGFGDEYPTPSTWKTFIPMFLYLTVGMILSGMLFNVLHDKMKRIHKIGTKVKGARNVTVWFGSKQMKVAKLLEIVAEEFDAKPREIHEMLHRLDELLEHEVERRESFSESTISIEER
ncbi:hypothetical protein FO519_002864 [Halicephalobus sp. NKZ332]|nr:hypothetical protein FO519_002864 [Halicephalobus sp. NKZ332]